MVFVPRPPITATTLGVDGSVPRGVPSDLVVALLARVLPADPVQHALLLLVLVLAGWGVGRLAPSTGGGTAAAIAYVWNPYVAERLVIGHWAFLLGYALLPWVAGAALALRRGAESRAWPLLAWLGGAALAGGTAGVIATGVALAVLGLRPAPARSLAVLAFAAAANAPWWLPALARQGGVPSDPAGVTAFAARADSPLGVVGSLATLGGIWNPAVWPPERGYLLLALAALAGVAAAVVLGLRPLLAADAMPGGRGLVAAGAAGFGLALAGGLAVSRAPLAVIVTHVPGAGLLRDGQKYLAPAALVAALAAGHAVARLATGRHGRPYAVLLGLLPVLVLPSLAWGASGRLAAVHYPASWMELRTATAAAPAGDVAVLPWRLYRRFDWNGDRVLLDPMPRLLPKQVVTNDDLPLSTVTVRGEDPRAARITAGLDSGADLVGLLRAQGIRYAVVHRTQAGAGDVEAALAGLPERYRSADLLLVDLLLVDRSGHPAAARSRPALLIGIGLGAAAVGGAFCLALVSMARCRLLRSRAPKEKQAG
jgi:hypothetical protein